MGQEDHSAAAMTSLLGGNIKEKVRAAVDRQPYHLASTFLRHPSRAILCLDSGRRDRRGEHRQRDVVRRQHNAGEGEWQTRHGDFGQYLEFEDSSNRIRTRLRRTCRETAGPPVETEKGLNCAFGEGTRGLGLDLTSRGTRDEREE